MGSRVQRSVAVLLLVGGLAACGSSNQSSPAKAGQAGFGDHLSRVPLDAAGDLDDAETTMISWVNLERASELAGLTRPSDKSAEAKWLTELLAKGNDPTSGVVLALPRLIRDPSPDRYDAVAKEIGFQPGAISASLEIDRPPLRYAVLTGTFNDETLTAAMGEPTDDVWSIGPDEDFKADIKGRSDIRRIGEGIRFARSGDALLSSTDSTLVTQGKELPSTGKGLTDRPQLRAIAEQLDAANAYSALITDGVSTGGGASRDPRQAEVRKRLGLSTNLQPFLAIGVGLTDTTTAVLVFVHASPESAEQNKDALEDALKNGTDEATGQPLSTFFTVESLTQNESALTANVRFLPTRARAPFDMLARQSAPFRN